MRPIVILALVLLTVVGCDTAKVPSAQPTARPTASPVTAAAATIEPTPIASLAPAPSATGEIRWDRIGGVVSPSVANGGGPFRVVGFADGYVLLDMTSTVQFSPDGVKWTPVRLPFGEGSALGTTSFATNGQHVLVAGSHTPCRIAAYQANPFGPCRERPASWVSDDGLTWQASDAWTGAVGPTGQSGSSFTAAWTVPTGGWDAAQAFDTGDESDVGSVIGPALWHSEDGRAWSLLSAKPAEPTSDCDPYWSADSFWALADADGLRVAHVAASECAGVDTSLSLSTDGRRYERLHAFPGSGGWVQRGLEPIGSGPWVFAGGRQVSDSASEAMTWASGDLSTWTTTALPVPSEVRQSRAWALGHGKMGYVAVGQASSGSEYDRVITWMSDDGAAWRIADVRPSQAFAIEEIADGPAGMLGLGSVLLSEDEDQSVYRLDVWKLGLRR
jgi:hypothetical protein